MKWNGMKWNGMEWNEMECANGRVAGMECANGRVAGMELYSSGTNTHNNRT